MTESRSLPDLPNKPGKTNWVEKAGGLPSYIERVAKHLHSEKGYTVSRAIATAVNHAKKMCGSGTAFGGKVKVSAKARAVACKAVAAWEAKKGKAKLSEAEFVAQVERIRAELYHDVEFAELAGAEVEAEARLNIAESCLAALDEPTELTHQMAVRLLEGRAAEVPDDLDVDDLRKRLEDEAEADRALVEVLQRVDPTGPHRGLEEAPRLGSVIQWDPRLHPRDRVGRFRSMLTDLGKNDLIELPGSIIVRRVGRVGRNTSEYQIESGGVRRERGGAEERVVRTASRAAHVALDLSARSGHPDSLGRGRTFKSLKEFEKYEQATLRELKRHKGGVGAVGLEALGVVAQTLLEAETLEEIATTSGPPGRKPRRGAPPPTPPQRLQSLKANPSGKNGKPPPGKDGKPGDEPNRDFEQQHPRDRTGRWVLSQGDGMEGQADERVRMLQQRLVAAGYQITVDGRFGPETSNAVRRFQAEHGLATDSVVGDKTRHALRHPEAGAGGPGNNEGISVDELKQKINPDPQKDKNSNREGESPTDRSSRLSQTNQQESKRAADSGSAGGSGDGGQAEQGADRAEVEAGRLKRGRGMSGKPDKMVRNLQRVLDALGYDLGEAGVDGRFGPLTAEAVKSFQEQHDLDPDGIVGPKTLKALKKQAKKSSQKASDEGIVEAARQLDLPVVRYSIDRPDDDTDSPLERRLQEAVALRLRAVEAGDVATFTLARARENHVRDLLRLEEMTVKWDEQLHPRSRGGKFAEVLTKLTGGQSVKVKMKGRGGIKVTKSKHGSHWVVQRGTEVKRVKDQAAAEQAVEDHVNALSAKTKSVIGTAFSHAAPNPIGAMHEGTEMIVDMINSASFKSEERSLTARANEVEREVQASASRGQVVRIRNGATTAISGRVESTRMSARTVTRGNDVSSAHLGDRPRTPLAGGRGSAIAGVGKMPRSPLVDNPLLDLFEAVGQNGTSDAPDPGTSDAPDPGTPDEGGFDFDPQNNIETFERAEELGEGEELCFTSGVMLGHQPEGWVVVAGPGANLGGLFDDAQTAADVATAVHDRLIRKYGPVAADGPDETEGGDVEEAVLEEFDFDPHLHPRDREGRFREVLAKLQGLDTGKSVSLGRGLHARKTGRHSFQVTKKRTEGDLVKDAPNEREAAALAANLDVRVQRRERSVGRSRKEAARAGQAPSVGEQVTLVKDLPGPFSTKERTKGRRARVVKVERDPRSGMTRIQVNLGGSKVWVFSGDLQRSRRLSENKLVAAFAEAQRLAESDGKGDYSMQGGGAMKRCSSCGWKNKMGATKCKKCGANLRSSGDPKDKRVEEAPLSSKSRNDLPASSFVFPGERRYPIHDLSHARNALARASGKPEEAKVKAAVYKRYPQLRKSEEAVVINLAEALRQVRLGERRGKGGASPLRLAMETDINPAIKGRREEQKVERPPSPTAMQATGSPVHRGSKSTEKMPLRPRKG